MSKFSKKFCGKSPFKHYKSDGKVLNKHSHTNSEGDVSYHGRSKQTGQDKSYAVNEDGELVQHGSSSGRSGF